MLDKPLSRRQLALRLSAPLALVGAIRVGHFTGQRRPTGCTAILFDAPVAAA